MPTEQKVKYPEALVILTLRVHKLIHLVLFCCCFFCYNSPPTSSEGHQPKTQAASTQEELTQDERPCSVETSTAEMDSNGQIQSVLPIIKSPSPDVHGHYPPVEPEPLGQKRTGLQRYTGGCLNIMILITLCGPRENNKLVTVTCKK